MIRQALHIFLKDTRQFRYSIVVLMVWTLFLAASWLSDLRERNLVNVAYSVIHSSAVILPIVWCYLVARIVHSESLAGTRQFWLSRPYRRSSLFVSKATFVAAYLILPLATAQLVALTFRGFPVGDSVAAVAWEQLLYVVIWVLPAMAIAALTTSLVQFVPAMVVVAVLLVVVDGGHQWGRFAWIPYTLGLGVAAAGASTVIYLQFRHRREYAGRVLGLSAVLVAIACVAFFPWRAAIAVQSSLTEDRSEDVTAAIRTPEPRLVTPLGHTGQFQFRVELAGLPSDAPITCHTGEMVVRRPDGGTWQSGPQKASPVTRDLGFVDYGCSLWFNTGTALNIDEVVDVDISLFATVFGSPQATTVDVGAKAIPVAGAGICSAVQNVYAVQSGQRTQVVASCENAFRGAPGIVQLKVSSRDVAFSEPGSYSPFPATLQLDPTVRTAAAILRATDRIDVLTRSPVMHVQRTVRLKGIRLADYELRLP